MLPETTNKYSFSPFLLCAALLLPLVCCFLIVPVDAQTVAANSKKISSPSRIEMPLWQTYRGVSLGMTEKEVRDKLGDPKSVDAQGFFYMFSETESAQVLFNNEKKVRTISVFYTAEHANAPKYTDVFEPGVTVEPKPDGAIYKLARYPEAGFWISYNRMAGAQAMVVVMIQKM